MLLVKGLSLLKSSAGGSSALDGPEGRHSEEPVSDTLQPEEPGRSDASKTGLTSVPPAESQDWGQAGPPPTEHRHCFPTSSPGHFDVLQGHP